MKIENFEYNPQFLRSVLLLVLAVSGNFVGNTLGCKTQYHMTKNMYVKHIVLLCIIYFTLSFTNDKFNNPVEIFKNTLLIWLAFIIFTKQNITLTAISAFLFFSTYILHTFTDYYNNKLKETKDKNEINNLNKKLKNITYLRNITWIAGFIILIIGFISYLKEKKDEYKNDFDITKFLFGIEKCNILN
jgi:hypothetical protein